MPEKKIELTTLNPGENMVFEVTVLKEKNEYYLKLVPYKNSYFQTDLNYKDLKLKIHMSLFAITESK